VDSERLRDLLAAVSEVLVGSLGGLERRLRVVALACAESLEVDRCWICVVDGDVLRTLAGVSMGMADPKFDPLPIGKGVVGRCARDGVTQRIDDVMRDPDYYAATALTRSEIAAPILRGAEVVGVLNVEANRMDAFGDHEQKVVEAVASLLGPHL
jgi:putative methionine-R-sulfoxide reductase with GAF domain